MIRPRRDTPEAPLQGGVFPTEWRVLVTGITSIHGWPIYQALKYYLLSGHLYGIRPPKAKLPVGSRIASFCITDKQSLQEIRAIFRPTHVVHCAGVCDLDVCEDRPLWARDVNVGGTAAVAEVFGADASIYYMSTDLVFSGENPPSEGYAEIHTPDPISVAGKTFAEAESAVLVDQRHCVVRLALPLGESITGNKGAVDWIEGRFRRNKPATLFFDEYRSCVSCKAIGEMALGVLSGEMTGLYHFGGERPWSLYEIGKYVLKRGPYDSRLLKGMERSQEVNGPPRIGNVALDSRKLKEALGVWI